VRTSTSRQITSGGGYRLPQWSSDGRSLAAIKSAEPRRADTGEALTEDDESWMPAIVGDELRLLNLDGQEERVVAEFNMLSGNYPVGIVHFAWAENDTHLLYSTISSRGISFDFYKVRVAIGNELTEELGYGLTYYFRLNADNQTVGIQLVPPQSPVAVTDAVPHLFIAESNSSSTKSISASCKGDKDRPTWSPDGKSIAYICDNRNLHVLELATGKEQIIYTSRSAPSALFDEPALFHTDWSQSGNWIAFSYQSRFLSPLAPPGGEIWLIRADGSGSMFLTIGSDPVWRPTP
jgi:Tol biopolymer transport system component